MREAARGVVHVQEGESLSSRIKADAVKLVQSGPPDVVRELGLVESTLRYWVSRAEIDAGVGPPGARNTSEREELAKLRKENTRLQMERDILKAAATFFAKESE